MPETVLYSLEDLSRILRVGTDALKKEIEMRGLKKMVPRNSFPKQIMQMPAWKLHGIIITLTRITAPTIYGIVCLLGCPLRLFFFTAAIAPKGESHTK